MAPVRGTREKRKIQDSSSWTYIIAIHLSYNLDSTTGTHRVGEPSTTMDNPT